MQVQPYLFFDGRCDEALDFYKKAVGAKVETLKGGDYVRLWINKGGNHYLVHFPA